MSSTSESGLVQQMVSMLLLLRITWNPKLISILGDHVATAVVMLLVLAPWILYFLLNFFLISNQLRWG